MPDGCKDLANTAKEFFRYLLQWVSTVPTHTVEAEKSKIIH